MGGMFLDEKLKKDVLFEHRFWLQVLGDHSRFILMSLAPAEKEEIQRAQYFKQVFDQLLERVHKPLHEEELMEVTRKALHYAKEIREFKLKLIKRHIIEKINIELPPSFINHMVNEVEEYIGILNSILCNEIPNSHPVHYHLLWLLDAVGHADGIYTKLDYVEKEMRKRSMAFTERFRELNEKAVEMAGYLRTNVKQFPSLLYFNREVEEEIKSFMDFLEELLENRLRDETLGTLNPLLPDHMFREECYYLTKLSRVSQIKSPQCDPGKQRIQI
jgi:hypothetical protein